jgi:hypothetical protein
LGLISLLYFPLGLKLHRGLYIPLSRSFPWYLGGQYIYSPPSLPYKLSLLCGVIFIAHHSYGKKTPLPFQSRHLLFFYSTGKIHSDRGKLGRWCENSTFKVRGVKVKVVLIKNPSFSFHRHLELARYDRPMSNKPWMYTYES